MKHGQMIKISFLLGVNAFLDLKLKTSLIIPHSRTPLWLPYIKWCACMEPSQSPHIIYVTSRLLIQCKCLVNSCCPLLFRESWWEKKSVVVHNGSTCFSNVFDRQLIDTVDAELVGRSILNVCGNNDFLLGCANNFSPWSLLETQWWMKPGNLRKLVLAAGYLIHLPPSLWM